MFSVTLKKTTEKGIEMFGNDVANQVVDVLATKYNFDPDEAKEFLGIEIKKSKAYTAKAAPTIPLPFCGVIEESWCQAIVSNKKLFTQCRKSKFAGRNMCKGCCTAAIKNDGNPVYGFIQDRLNDEYTDKHGKKPKNYGNVMKTLGITREQAQAEADKMGWTIPETQFDVIVAKKGRKKGSTKNASSSDSEEDTTKETPTSDDDSIQEEKVIESDSEAEQKEDILVIEKDKERESDDKKKKKNKTVRKKVVHKKKVNSDDKEL